MTCVSKHTHNSYGNHHHMKTITTSSGLFIAESSDTFAFNQLRTEPFESFTIGKLANGMFRFVGIMVGASRPEYGRLKANVVTKEIRAVVPKLSAGVYTKTCKVCMKTFSAASQLKQICGAVCRRRNTRQYRNSRNKT